MGSQNIKVVRVTAHCVSRTVKIPLFEPERRRTEPKNLANDARIPEGVRPVAVSGKDVRDTPVVSGALVQDAKLFVEQLSMQKPQEVSVQRVAPTQVVLPK